MPTLRKIVQSMVAFSAASVVVTTLPPAVAAEAPVPGEYRVTGGKVDPGTFRGWLTYHIACQSCHGRDGVSVGLAPDLLRSLAFMPQPEFARKVLTRYRVSLGLTESLLTEGRRQSLLDEVMRQQLGEQKGSAMPIWQSDPVIAARVMDLHAYLKARADGVLPPGQPATEEPLPAGR